MEDIVALSNSLRNRHSSPRATAIDAIPPLVRTLPQVHAETNRLPHLPSQNAAALRLFSNLGFEVENLRRAISRLDSTSITEAVHAPEPPFQRPDWLAQIASEETRINLNTDLRQLSAQVFHNETKQASLRLLNKLRTLPIPEALTTLHTPQTSKTKITQRSTYTPVSPAASVTPTHLPYLSAIRSIVQNGDAPSAPTLMHETAATMGDDSHFVECLAVVASVARHSPPNQPPLPDMVVWGARVVLEDQFGEHVPGLPSKPRLARPAAVIPPIVDFVKHKYDEFFTDTIIWAVAFYCLRIGHVRAALQVLQDSELSAEDHGKCLSCMERFAEGISVIQDAFLTKRRALYDDGPSKQNENTAERDLPMTPGCLLSEEDYRDLAEEYQRIAWYARKPFVRLVYVLLSRLELLPYFGSTTDHALQSSLDLSKHPTPGKHEQFSMALPEEDVAELLPSVEDYVWFRLWLCRTPAESQMLSVLCNSNFVTQAQIQEDISGYGSAHFDPEGEQPLVYAFVLVATGMYENAFPFLFAHPDERCLQYAIHFAIVLYHLNWMKDEDSFHKQLAEFVSVFSSLYPVEAALYLMIVKDPEVLQQSLKELVISTGEYEALLGRIGLDLESDQTGALTDIITAASVPLPSGFNQTHLQVVRTEAAVHGAMSAASKCDYATAAELYSLAGDPVKRVEMVMQNLADVVHRLSSSGRSLAVAEGKNALRIIERSGSLRVPEKVLESLNELLRVAEVFEEYWTGRYGSAWNALRHIRILPLSTEGFSESNRPPVTVDGRFDHCVGKCLLELLKVGLHIAECALERKSVASDANKACEVTQELYPGEPRIPDANEVKSLCIFAAILGVTDSTVNERLVKIEVLLA